MLRQLNQVDEQALVTDMVTQDYRTAPIFRGFGIDFCCGAGFSLEAACNMRGLDLAVVKGQLEDATRDMYIPNSLKFDEWDLCFLADYIVHIYHDHLRLAMPETMHALQLFAEGHRTKYGWLPELENEFANLVNTMLPHLKQEEEIIFPYIRRILHAYNSKESYASLLVRTLRKPVEEVMRHEHDGTVRSLTRIRALTGNYTPPPNSCTNHKLCFAMLRGLDDGMIQHLHLENNILFPKAIAMEKELLRLPDR